MSHYQKLATVVVRLLSVTVMTVSVLYVLYVLTILRVTFGGSASIGTTGLGSFMASAMISSGAVCAFVGGILYAVSAPVARLIGKGM